MHLGEPLAEVAVAFIGDDHRGASLGDEKISASQAHIGLEIAFAQNLARLAHHIRNLDQPAGGIERGVAVAEKVGNLLLGLVDSRADDVARRLVCELQYVFAKIGLNDLDAFIL